MKRKVKIWNGRGWKPKQHIYVGAYSQKHAMELVNSVAGYNSACSIHEIRTYWSPGCWGNVMDGIEPEVGVWVTEGNEYGQKPKKLI